MSDETVTAAFLIIGNEILSGRTKDKNLGFLAEKLTETGIRLSEVRVVRDEEGEIVAAVRALSEAYTYVFTSGGIGPTHDDITCASIAAAFNKPVIRNPEAMRRMAGSVCVVSTGDGETKHAMSATAVTSLAMDPPSLLVCVNRAVPFHDAMSGGEQFCINILNAEIGRAHV